MRLPSSYTLAILDELKLELRVAQAQEGLGLVAKLSTRAKPTPVAAHAEVK
jgi:hypothetical protein